MKKTLLLLTLCLVSIITNAQKIDTTLLYGKWELYSMRDEGHSLCRDSLAHNIEDLILRYRADDTAKRLTPSDSLKLAMNIKAEFDEIFKTNMTFEKNGNAKVQYGFSESEGFKLPEQMGTYEWSGENKITQKIVATEPMVYIIKSLTEKKLVMRTELKDLEMTFTRAK